MTKIEKDPQTGVNTTGHEWDGIKELDNKTPSWITFTIILTIFWAIGYAVLYPSIPSLSGHTKGTLNYSPRVEVEKEIASAKLDQKEYLDKIDTFSVKGILADNDVRRFALRGGEVAFKENCSQCHGVGGTGSLGYPNLADNDWIWGGKIKDIAYTITNGVRSDLSDDTRSSEMTAFTTEDIAPSDVNNLVQYVRSIAGLTHDKDSADLGKVEFENNCTQCHSANGIGNQELGSPALNDAIWLHSKGSSESIKAQIRNPKMGEMPAWKDRLDKTTIKMLTAYVYNLGNQQ